MPLVEYVPDAKPQNEPQLPKVQSDAFKGVIVDDKYNSLRSLSAYAEGSPMTVTYYRQVLGENNDVREADPAQNAVYQQYSKINDLVIRVEEDLTQSVSDETNLSLITGSANLNPTIIPNTFDYFITRTTEGLLTLFRISNVKRKSMQRNSMHSIEYNMVGYIGILGEAKTIYETLEKKVTSEFYFHVDRLVDGFSPLLKTEDHNSVIQLQDEYRKLVPYYFSTFVNIGYKTLVLPGMPSAIYDKFLVDFLFKIVSIDDYENFQDVKQMGVDRDRYTEQPQFWKAIIERNPLYIRQANKMMVLVGTRLFNRNTDFGGVGVSTIMNYVYPATVDQTANVNDYPTLKVSSETFFDVIMDGFTFFSGGNNIYVTATGDTPLYKAVLADTYYVLSEAFYESSANWCVLEKVVWDYLENRVIQPKELQALINQFYYLNRLEQFYYGPLLMILILDSRSNTYSQ